MDSQDFMQSFAAQFERCESVLQHKGAEYATDDRLHNFRVAAELQHITMKQALCGMMAKHTVSVYDLALETAYVPIEKWQEKITDHMNYLFILMAIIDDEATRDRIRPHA